MLSDTLKHPVPIRPHHGMCLAYFQGNGYSEGFAGHMQEMLDLFEKDIPVKLTAAVDEICSACPNNKKGRCKDEKLVEDYDRAVLEFCGLEEGQELSFMEFIRSVQRDVIEPGHRPEICGNCQWNYICGEKTSRWENK